MLPDACKSISEGRQILLFRDSHTPATATALINDVSISTILVGKEAI